ncbi:MAG: hypothetical protein M1819_003940 [Sarea resinae]|nr:MAG: hypothetical protein M1819_003940 [Sarea resinae]
MCVAELNVSTQPCHHRWYHLIRRCSAERDLSNCPSKLSLEGWESKCDECPWCSDVTLDHHEYRLLGPYHAHQHRPSVGQARTPPMTPHESFVSRSNSSRGSLSRTDSSASVTSMRNRKQIAKIEAILPPDTLTNKMNGTIITEGEPMAPMSTWSASARSSDSLSRSANPRSGRMVNLADRSWVKSKRWSCGLIK